MHQKTITIDPKINHLWLPSCARWSRFYRKYGSNSKHQNFIRDPLISNLPLIRRVSFLFRHAPSNHSYKAFYEIKSISCVLLVILLALCGSTLGVIGVWHIQINPLDSIYIAMIPPAVNVTILFGPNANLLKYNQQPCLSCHLTIERACEVSCRLPYLYSWS